MTVGSKKQERRWSHIVRRMVAQGFIFAPLYPSDEKRDNHGKTLPKRGVCDKPLNRSDSRFALNVLGWDEDKR